MENLFGVEAPHLPSLLSSMLRSVKTVKSKLYGTRMKKKYLVVLHSDKRTVKLCRDETRTDCLVMFVKLPKNIFLHFRIVLRICVRKSVSIW